LSSSILSALIFFLTGKNKLVNKLKSEIRVLFGLCKVYHFFLVRNFALFKLLSRKTLLSSNLTPKMLHALKTFMKILIIQIRPNDNKNTSSDTKNPILVLTQIKRFSYQRHNFDRNYQIHQRSWMEF